LALSEVEGRQPVLYLFYELEMISN
jgi:hypothetical protein